MEVIAIDGPAGAGKSEIARRLAQDLGWAYLDTGAMYRAVTREAQRLCVDLSDAAGLARLAAGLDLHLSREGRVKVGGADVTRELRTDAVNAAVSGVAGVPEVREVMVAHQRRFAAENERVVAEGRDIGTVVFPDAVVKVFLDADPNVRAHRRHAQEQGSAAVPGDVEAVRAGIEARDRLDRTRPVSPLRQAPDAWCLDTTSLTLDEVYQRVRTQVRSLIRP